MSTTDTDQRQVANVWRCEDRIVLAVAWHPDIVKAARGITGAWYHRTIEVWSFPATSAPAVSALATTFGLTVAPNVGDVANEPSAPTDQWPETWRKVRRARCPVHFVSAPVTEFDSDVYTAVVTTCAPTGALVVGAAGLFPTTRLWQRRWPKLLPHLEAVHVVGRPDGSVGAGVDTEIRDALGARLLVRWESPGQPCDITSGDQLRLLGGGRNLSVFSCLRNFWDPALDARARTEHSQWLQHLDHAIKESRSHYSALSPPWLREWRRAAIARLPPRTTYSEEW